MLRNFIFVQHTLSSEHFVELNFCKMLRRFMLNSTPFGMCFPFYLLTMLSFYL